MISKKSGSNKTTWRIARYHEFWLGSVESHPLLVVYNWAVNDLDKETGSVELGLHMHIYRDLLIYICRSNIYAHIEKLYTRQFLMYMYIDRNSINKH